MGALPRGALRLRSRDGRPYAFISRLTAGEMHGRLQAYAHRRGMVVSEVIRRALAKHLDDELEPGISPGPRLFIAATTRRAWEALCGGGRASQLF